MSMDGCLPPAAKAALPAGPEGEELGRLKIFLLARALGFGGTERQLATLAQGLARHGHHVTVATFYPGGAFAEALAGGNPERLVLDKRGRWDVLGFVGRLMRAIWARRPDVIYSFLPMPNLLAAFARQAACRPAALVWGIRGTPLDLTRYDWLETASIWAERLAGAVPDLVIANSKAGAAWAGGRQFGARRVALVANGIDTDAFRPARGEERAAARRAFGCPQEAFVVAVVARLDPMKDHATFLQALAIAARAAPHLRALIVGDGPGPAAARLRELAGALGIADRVIWAGARQDVREVYHAADLLCLPSAFGEGFPNVVGEAMASGLSCVVTAVGDSADLVGATGRVLPPRDADALAGAMLDYVRAIRNDPPGKTIVNLAARQRIVEHFGVEAMVCQTEQLFRKVVAARRPREG